MSTIIYSELAVPLRNTVEKSQYDGWIMINLCAIRIPNPDELPNELDNKVSQKNIEVVDIIQDVSWYTEVQQSMGILSIHCMFRTNKN
ncbi:MAG: DUF1643 domain-containing protein [Lachnospiraceae bacterium]|nr:DUF1643 domain-containing protein [Lachnospiraceae bacterium]